MCVQRQGTGVRNDPAEKVYQIAYLTSKGELKNGYGKMTYLEAISYLSLNSTINSNNQKYGKTWGIYTNKQSYGKALAVAFGCYKKPEVHENKLYGHYHNKDYCFHIWFGGKILY